jgi:hypothetical protein
VFVRKPSEITSSTNENLSFNTTWQKTSKTISAIAERGLHSNKISPTGNESMYAGSSENYASKHKK